MKPDFTGDYVLNRDASRLSAAVAEQVQNAGLRIQHNEPNFSCQGSFSFANSQPVEWAFELVAKEREATETDPSASRLYWDGVALVCMIRHGAMTITFVYDFDAEGHLRLAEQLRGTDHDQDNLWIFDRC